MTQAYPLAWPKGRPRTAPNKRRAAPFSTTRESASSTYRQRVELSVNVSVDRLLEALRRLAARQIVISTNVRLRSDGFPRSGERAPDDPGVAVYFRLDGKSICMPCDTYTKVAGNLAAVAAHIDATRMIERHGVASVAEMFRGFVAIAPPDAVKPWWEVLGCLPDDRPETIKACYHAKARVRHPDNGGSDALMAELSDARDRALRERA